jgi:hypothetical protein
MNNRISYNLTVGGINGDAISNDQNFTDCIIIASPISSHHMKVLGIQVRFPDDSEDALIQIKDSDQNLLISGNVQLSQIGNRSKADILRDEFPVDFLLKVGTTMIISIKPATGKSLAKEKLNVTLFGEKVVKT